MRVAMQKLDGVESVRVSLNEGLTVLDLKRGNKVTLGKIREVIKNNGFVSKEAKLAVQGVVSALDDELVLDVAPTKASCSVAIRGTAPHTMISVSASKDVRSRTWNWPATSKLPDKAPRG